MPVRINEHLNQPNRIVNQKYDKMEEPKTVNTKTLDELGANIEELRQNLKQLFDTSATLNRRFKTAEISA